MAENTKSVTLPTPIDDVRSWALHEFLIETGLLDVKHNFKGIVTIAYHVSQNGSVTSVSRDTHESH